MTRIKEAADDLEVIRKKIERQAARTAVCGVKGHNWWRFGDGSYSCLDCNCTSVGVDKQCQHDWKFACFFEKKQGINGTLSTLDDIICFKCRLIAFKGDKLWKAIHATHIEAGRTFIFNRKLLNKKRRKPLPKVEL